MKFLKANLYYAAHSVPQRAPMNPWEDFTRLNCYITLLWVNKSIGGGLQIVLGLLDGLDLALICLDQSASSRVLFARNESQVPKVHTLGIVLHLWEQRYSTPNAGNLDKVDEKVERHTLEVI